jgi:DNA-directed RNA polymerase specialized sigma24 family protein
VAFLGEPDDDELLARYATGDPEAFVAFYRRHLPAMLGFFLRRTRDRELTADLTAEVFAAALIAAGRYRPGERPALAWLYGIAAHKLTDSRRRGRVQDACARPRASGSPSRRTAPRCDASRRSCSRWRWQRRSWSRSCSPRHAAGATRLPRLLHRTGSRSPSPMS